LYFIDKVFLAHCFTSSCPLISDTPADEEFLQFRDTWVVLSEHTE